MLLPNQTNAVNPAITLPFQYEHQQPANGGDRKSEAAKSVQGHCPRSSREPYSRDKAADAVGISGKTVSAAKPIQQEDPELFEEIKAGEPSVAMAMLCGPGIEPC